MKTPKLLDSILNGEDAIKTSVAIDKESIFNLCAAVLLMLVLAFLAYKIIVKDK
jgi:hypothetical protein